MNNKVDNQEQEDFITKGGIYECTKLLSLYLQTLENKGKYEADKIYHELLECLQPFGDIYGKLKMELYVNPRNRQIMFPDNPRIQAHLNTFLRESRLGNYAFMKEMASRDRPLTPEEDANFENTLNLYQILLNDRLRTVYNEYYRSHFAEPSSILPKEYGISKLLGGIKGRGIRRTKRRRMKPRKTNKLKKVMA